MAAGEPAGAADSTHLKACTACQEELSTYRRVVAALAEPIETVELPAGLWDRIEPGLVDAAAAGPDLERTADGGLQLREAPGQQHRTTQRGETPGLQRRTARRGGASAGRSRWALAAAAAVGVLLGAGGLGLGSTLLGDRPGPSDPGPGASEPAPPSPPESSPAPVAVGSATLAPATEDGVSGDAVMTRDPDGQLELALELSDVPSGGYREVWLRDEAGSRLLSLGTMSTASARMGVPEGVDLEQFPVLDVSQEDFDGDPSHSGLTLAEGAMVGAE